jgi:hypothetical protein
MYGSSGGTTSSFWRAGVNALESRIEFPRHVTERGCQRRSAPDQDVIVTSPQASRGSAPDQFAQAASNPVAHHRIADLPRHGEAHTHRTFVSTAARLQHERTGGRTHGGGDGPKVRPALQPLRANVHG